MVSWRSSDLHEVTTAMILQIWAILAALAIIMIVLGLTKPSESAQALVGFLFLFLLGFPILNGSLEYQTGETVQTNFTYSTAGNLTSTDAATVYTYSTYQSHWFGYYLILAAAIGFILVLFGIRNTRRMEQ